MRFESDTQAIMKGLLGRGGSNLLTAAVAHAHGIRMGTHKWHALSPDLIASTEQVLGFLSQNVAVTWLEMAIRPALQGEETASLPTWLTPIFRRPEALSHIGRHVSKESIAPALGIRAHHPSARYMGLAAVAVSLSRMQDTLECLARRLFDEDGALLVRMGRLAGVTIAPGMPTRMRRTIKELLKEVSDGANH